MTDSGEGAVALDGWFCQLHVVTTAIAESDVVVAYRCVSGVRHEGKIDCCGGASCSCGLGVGHGDGICHFHKIAGSTPERDRVMGDGPTSMRSDRDIGGGIASGGHGRTN